MPLDIELEWALVEHQEDSLWRRTRVLYTLHHPETDRLLYLGKAEFQTVRARLNCRSKDSVWDHIEKVYGIDSADLRVATFMSNARLTVELLADTESLLIKRLQPCANVQSMQSRIERPGLRVACTGDWPLRRNRFVDR